jgi:hypothetical protein
MSGALDTLLLDTVAWDLVVGSNGNIAMASPPYASAQDAASAIKLFQGELWYDTALGIPYFQQILGQFPSLALIKLNLTNAALTVPGVVSAVCYITGFTDRVLSGQVQVTNAAGKTTAADIAVFPQPFVLNVSSLNSANVLT